MKAADDFPILYHAHHNRHLEDLPFWLSLATRYGSPILELGCGSGRILSPLCEAGYRMVGMDNEPAMLRYLQQHWDGNEPPALLTADMIAFRLAPVFHLAILPCNTFSTLTDAQRGRTLTAVRSCLKPGGAFAVSMPNPQLLKHMPRESRPEVEEIFPHPVDGEPVQVSGGWQRTRDTFTLQWHYDHLLPDGQVERTTAIACHFLENIERYLQEFRQAGFENVSVFGDFDESLLTENSPDLIFVAE